MGCDTSLQKRLFCFRKKTSTTNWSRWPINSSCKQAF